MLVSPDWRFTRDAGVPFFAVLGAACFTDERVRTKENVEGERHVGS
jgi:hypothetical protein